MERKNHPPPPKKKKKKKRKNLDPSSGNGKSLYSMDPIEITDPFSEDY
jgi:hypothetical protein